MRYDIPSLTQWIGGAMRLGRDTIRNDHIGKEVSIASSDVICAFGTIT